MANKSAHLFTVTIGRRVFGANDIHALRAAVREFIDSNGYGASQIGSEFKLAALGKVIGHMSYNGRCWRPNPAKPLGHEEIESLDEYLPAGTKPQPAPNAEAAAKVVKFAAIYMAALDLPDNATPDKRAKVAAALNLAPANSVVHLRAHALSEMEMALGRGEYGDAARATELARFVQVHS